MKNESRKKLQRALLILQEIAVSDFTKAPPIHRAAWKLGVIIPPPLFASFGFNFALLGGIFAGTWGAFMFWFFTFVNDQDSRNLIPILVAGSVGAGVLFGLAMASYCRFVAIRKGLPKWQSLAD